MLDPKVIICDEPVSALDVSVQAQILNLLEDMKARYGLTLIFIAHDLAVVKNVSDRVIVMYLGKICEVAHPDALYGNPAHPYTKILLASIPEPDPLRPITDDRHLGRAAVTDVAAIGLPVPHPLPTRARRVRQRGTGDRRDHAWPFRRLPLPSRSRGRHHRQRFVLLTVSPVNCSSSWLRPFLVRKTAVEAPAFGEENGVRS